MRPAWATWQGPISQLTEDHGCKGRKGRTNQSVGRASWDDETLPYSASDFLHREVGVLGWVVGGEDEGEGLYDPLGMGSERKGRPQQVFSWE